VPAEAATGEHDSLSGDGDEPVCVTVAGEVVNRAWVLLKFGTI
jgi:hypothetical protein